MRLTRVFPFLHRLEGYSPHDYSADFLAALTIAPMAVPMAMAFAVVGGVSPEYACYTCMLPAMVAALFGSSRFLVTGPTNSMSLVLYSTLATISVSGVGLNALPPESRMAIVFGLAILTGLIQILMGLARLGELANFISFSVMAGVTTGLAVLTITSQLPTILGTDPAPGNFFRKLWQIGLHVWNGQFNIWNVGLTALTIALTLAFKRISRLFPATLAAMAAVSTVAWLAHAGERGVTMIGAVSNVVPPLSLPAAPDFELISSLVSPALALALLGAIQSLAIGKQLSNIRHDHFDGNRELIGQGLGNVAAGFTSGIPACGSFGLSAFMVSLGAKTRLATVFTALLVLPLLLLVSKLLAHVPMATLGGMLVLVGLQSVKPSEIRFSLTATRVDAAVFVCSFLATLILNLTQAILIGVLVSFALFIYKSAHPRVYRIERDDPHLPRPMPEGVSAYSIEGALFFGAIHELERYLFNLETSRLRMVVLKLSRVFWLDATGAHALEQFLERYHARGIPVVLVLDNPNSRMTLERTGVFGILGEGFTAETLGEGLGIAERFLRKRDGRRARHRKGKSDTVSAKTAARQG